MKQWTACVWCAVYCAGFPLPLQAEFYCAHPNVDLGRVYSGRPLRHEFHFVNKGNTTLEIVEIRPGCSCLAPELKQRKYRPGEKGVIPLNVNTLGESAGSHRWYAYVFVQEGRKRYQIPLQMSAFVIAEVTVHPAKLHVFMTGPLQQKIQLIDRRKVAAKITHLHSSSAHIKASAGFVTRTANGHSKSEIHLDFAATMPEGRHRELLTVYTSDPLHSPLKIPILITKRRQERIFSTPKSVDIVAIANKPIPSMIVLIRDRENEAVVITRVRSQHPAVNCRWTQEPEKLAAVRIQVKRSKLNSKALHTEIRVEIGQPTPTVLIIPVHCTTE